MRTSSQDTTLDYGGSRHYNDHERVRSARFTLAIQLAIQLAIK